MHYYKKNIGDYAKKAGRLSMLQHGSYTLLIDACYDRERFPTLEEAIDWTWASSKEEVEAVTFVLHKFFTKNSDGVLIQKRVQEELENYHKNAATNKRIANERETNRKAKSTNRERTVNEPLEKNNEAPPNQEPRTKNHNKESKPKKAKAFIPPSVKQVKEYCDQRGNKVDPDSFVDHYTANGWMRGKTKIKDWKACVRTWEKDNGNNNKQGKGTTAAEQFIENLQNA